MVPKAQHKVAHAVQVCSLHTVMAEFICLAINYFSQDSPPRVWSMQQAVLEQ